MKGIVGLVIVIIGMIIVFLMPERISHTPGTYAVAALVVFVVSMFLTKILPWLLKNKK